MKNPNRLATAQHFGLPACLWIPVAAQNTDTLEKYVGTIESERRSDGRTNALFIKPYPSNFQKTAALWKSDQGGGLFRRLHIENQVWVHVNYSGYRNAYLDFGLKLESSEIFLDHIQNRHAVRARNIFAPQFPFSYLRLCPVTRGVNTSGGHFTGGEGMEKEFVKDLQNKSTSIQQGVLEAVQSPIQFADPFDLTKMLDLKPGTGTLNGVRDIQHLFFT